MTARLRTKTRRTYSLDARTIRSRCYRMVEMKILYTPYTLLLLLMTLGFYSSPDNTTARSKEEVIDPTVAAHRDYLITQVPEPPDSFDDDASQPRSIYLPTRDKA